MNRTRQATTFLALLRLPYSRPALVRRGSRETAGAAAAVAIPATCELQRGQAPIF
jgi:hypothetical protein